VQLGDFDAYMPTHSYIFAPSGEMWPASRTSPTSLTAAAVILKGGIIVSLAALQLLWQLEARGPSLEREGDQLAVFPRELLTEEDRHDIQAHRDQLLHLVDYCERGGWEM
jgi:hypothetical protein